MTRRPTTDPGHDDALVAAALAAAVIAAAVGGWCSLRLAAWWDHTPTPPARPADFVRALAAHRIAWGTTATGAAVILGLLALGLLVGAVALVGRARPARARCDHAVGHLASRADLRPLRAPARADQARRLGLPEQLATTHPGLPVGAVLLPPNARATAPVFASWEDTAVIVAGPRTGKTTAFAIPMLLAAPGAALATSNKRDLLDATHRLRATGERRVWVFDPQHIAGHPGEHDGADPGWWWDPLSFLTHPRTHRIDPARAGALAAQLVTSATPAGGRTDAYFDVAKTDLLTGLLLAAAVGGLPVTVVWSWLCDPTDATPVRVLAEAGHGPHAEAVHAAAHLPDKQREGVYGSARTVVGFLLDATTTAWITPPAPGATECEQFSPKAFAASTDTLYLLSREGGPGAALVAALTVAVTDALEHRATSCAGGRLPVPFVAVLDEAANICRVRDLDSLYSHYGSRGICLVTILQNWAQGAVAWGEAGMEKLWSAANIRIYAGGVDDATFLRRLSDLIGEHRRVQHTRTAGRDGANRTRTLVRETTLTASDLRELPTGRAVCFASGTPAFLLAPAPWWTGPHAEAIRANLATTTDPAAAVPTPRQAPAEPATPELPGAAAPGRHGATHGATDGTVR
ncbi:MAG: type IV secretory system conjugative DNA transfer family protein [Actinobacteria bacterium]|nr:type IV secretory system conjugative DNA transfer family protein [Actinomycetota bacterium]